jgi:hypothetical protein
MRWISVVIILHNLIIEIEGGEGIYSGWEDHDIGDDGGRDNNEHTEDEDRDEDDPAVSKRNQLIAELLWAKYHERLEEV